MKRLVATAVLCAASVVHAAPARGDKLIAIYPLESEGVTPAATQQLDGLLRDQAKKLPGVILQSRAKVQRAIRRAAGKRRSCEGKLTCIVEVGELSGAHAVVFGTAKRGPDRYELDLRLIDVDTENVVQRVPGSLSGDAEDLTASSRGLLQQLLLPDQFSGTLAVSMLVPGARVTLDGLEVGVTPMESLTGLKPRMYTVAVALEGTRPLEMSVRVRQATITTLRVDLTGDELRGSLVQDSLLEKVVPPAVAHKLAAGLQHSPAPAPQPPLKEARGAVVTGADQPAATSGPAPAEDGETPPAPMPLAAISLAASGALVGVLGGAGIAAWGYNFNRASGAVSSDNVVQDQETFEAAQSERPLFDGLGIAGGVALPVGLVALAGGIGLLLWEPGVEPDE